MGNLSLTDPPEGTGTLTLQDEVSNSAPVQGATATNRAAKNHLAMGAASPGVDAIENMITTGQEDYLKTMAAQAKTQENQAQAYEHLNKLASLGNVTPQQAYEATKNLRNIKPVNPSTVLEKGFADEYMRLFTQHNT